MSNVREIFLDDGVDEQIIQELRNVWERKISETHAVDHTTQSTPDAASTTGGKANSKSNSSSASKKKQQQQQAQIGQTTSVITSNPNHVKNGALSQISNAEHQPSALPTNNVAVRNIKTELANDSTTQQQSSGANNPVMQRASAIVTNSSAVVMNTASATAGNDHRPQQQQQVLLQHSNLQLQQQPPPAHQASTRQPIVVSSNASTLIMPNSVIQQQQQLSAAARGTKRKQATNNETQHNFTIAGFDSSQVEFQSYFYFSLFLSLNLCKLTRDFINCLNKFRLIRRTSAGQLNQRIFTFLY